MASASVGHRLDDDIDYPPMWAGESCSVVNDVKAAGDIVRDLVGDARASLGEV